MVDVLRNSPRWFSTEDFPHELWRDVIDCEGLYQVSNLSRVKSLQGRKPRIFKYQINIDGYAIVSLSKGGKDKLFGVHVLVAALWLNNTTLIGQQFTI